MNITNQKFRYSILILIILSTFTDTLLRVKKMKSQSQNLKKQLITLQKVIEKYFNRWFFES